MYWNIALCVVQQQSASWIVTLDVLKFEVADVERLRRYGWIVTLDVLKWWSGNFLSLFLRVE